MAHRKRSDKMKFDCSFNFKRFPKLKQGYKKYSALDSKAYKLSRKDSDGYQKASDELREYAYGEFARMIYEELDPLKPILNNRKQNIEQPWDEVFDKPFSQLELNQKKCLVGLIEGKFLYVLPLEYYSD